MSNNDKKTMLLVRAFHDSGEKGTPNLLDGLRDDLLELDVDSVDTIREGTRPAGAKGDSVSLEKLLITLAASGGVLTSVISAIQSWLIRRSERSVEVEIDGDKLILKGSNSREQTKLINSWIRRHKRH